MFQVPSTMSFQLLQNGGHRKQMLTKEDQSIRYASFTIIGMILLLSIIAIISGGLDGLSGIPTTAAYCLAVAAPLTFLIILSWKKKPLKK
jgi:hypothetical protein